MSCNVEVKGKDRKKEVAKGDIGKTKKCPAKSTGHFAKSNSLIA
jgi:hypothetical protein